ncbi:hypothetical protein O181_078958 [Austropuccinia psidii MF-1]|uniref:GATA-type domain-containing protein n=1 Tax=Austropuccinia psidii MF-1 TaxID=1389203 RepID=A0A9Q3IF51_9BASI|nr:hypothetical protein [Austropuccinia psidii MF-1]
MSSTQRTQSLSSIPPSTNHNRRQSSLNLTSATTESLNPLASFTHFTYDQTSLGTFTLTNPTDETNSESGPSFYSNNSSGPYQLNQTNHSVYGSPPSNHSSPNPYGDFNPFPLSSPSTTGNLSSFLSQPHPPNTTNQLNQINQSLSPLDFSSSLHPTSFEISRSNHNSNLLALRAQRRESVEPAYQRRHSNVSINSLRTLHSSSPYTNYTSLDPNNSVTQPQIYQTSNLSADSHHPGLLYLESARHTVSPHPPPIMTSSPNILQSPLINDVSPLTSNLISQMGPPPQLPSKSATTRQYRKKTPPEACAVCGTTQTPEWRKGPSGLRTLCNACGLTAAKQPAREPTTIEEVWDQLREIGMNRFRGNFSLDERKKAAAAQNWSSQSQLGRPTQSSRTSYCSSATISPKTKPGRMSLPGPSPQSSKLSPNNRNPNNIDPSQNLFSISRERVENIGSSMPLANSNISSSNFSHLHSYNLPSVPHGASLNMAPSTHTRNGSQLTYSPSQLSPVDCQAHQGMLRLYSGSIEPSTNRNSPHGRRNSIGGHRMSISAIINQDPPTRSASSMEISAHLQQLQHQQQAHHLHPRLFLQHSSETGYSK